MEEFIKAAGAVLVTLILGSLLSARYKAYGSILTMGVCTMILLLGLRVFAPVMEFLRQLEELAGLQSDIIKILLRVSGVGILSEIIVLLCNDSGNASLGHGIRTLSTGVVLWMSLPIFQALVDLIRQILEGI